MWRRRQSRRSEYFPGSPRSGRHLGGDSRRPACGCGRRGHDGGDPESCQVAAAEVANSVAIVVNTTVAAADAATTAATEARSAKGSAAPKLKCHRRWATFFALGTSSSSTPLFNSRFNLALQTGCPRPVPRSYPLTRNRMPSILQVSFCLEQPPIISTVFGRISLTLVVVHCVRQVLPLIVLLSLHSHLFLLIVLFLLSFLTSSVSSSSLSKSSSADSSTERLPLSAWSPTIEACRLHQAA